MAGAPKKHVRTLYLHQNQLLSKMALEQLQTWQDYSNNTLYVKQTAIPLHAIQNIELLPDRKTTIEVIADKTNDLQYTDIIGGQGIVWV